MLDSPLSTHSFILPGESYAMDHSAQSSPGAPMSLQQDGTPTKVTRPVDPHQDGV